MVRMVMCFCQLGSILCRGRIHGELELISLASQYDKERMHARERFQYWDKKMQYGIG